MWVELSTFALYEYDCFRSIWSIYSWSIYSYVRTEHMDSVWKNIYILCTTWSWLVLTYIKFLLVASNVVMCILHFVVTQIQWLIWNTWLCLLDQVFDDNIKVKTWIFAKETQLAQIRKEKGKDLKKMHQKGRHHNFCLKKCD